MNYEWDESKRLANLAKHKLDFGGAHFIYEHPSKVTLNMTRKGENRKLDLAPVESSGMLLALVYVERGVAVRCISLRPANRKERSMYAASEP
jgi:uncharacterized DUF497 family protein